MSNAMAAESRPEKSEKRAAREVITEIAPNVLRSELPVDLPGLGHVNCYLLEDARGIAVVDPGLGNDESYGALQHRLGLAGFELRHVHSIVVTHSHYDHYGAAERLKEDSGAKIVAHPGLHLRQGGFGDAEDDAEFLDVDEGAPDPSRNPKFGHRTPWGTWSQPPIEVIELWERNGFDRSQFFAPEPDVTVADGAEIMLAGRPWVGVHTPGHTADHLCLYDAEHGLMITGDHVLPTITPHISGYADEEAPLASFIDSLKRMHSYDDVKLAMPAHGDPFDDLYGRADHICDHHVDRLDDIREAAAELGRAPVDAYMRATFRERSWGDMAASETYAHLDHLRDLGELGTEWIDGLLHFQPTGSD